MHWYFIEGMEENELTQGREDIASLIKDYKEGHRY